MGYSVLTICVWCWGTKYPLPYVQKLAGGVARNLKQPHKFVVVTDDPNRYRQYFEAWAIPREDMGLTKVKGCFARLRTFDPSWLRFNGVKEGERVAWLDLDLVVTRQIDEVFDRDEPLVVLRGANKVNPCEFNGSVLLMRAGAHRELWNDFGLDAVQEIPKHEFPDDQGWLWHKVPDAAHWNVGAPSGVYAFMKNGWPAGDRLPKDARIVCFPGWRDPARFCNLNWVATHWRA